MRAESQLQRACVRWFRIQHRQHSRLLFAIPNGALLQGTKIDRAKQWHALEREGAVAGAPDLFLAIPARGFHGIFIEMKTSTGRQTPEQRAFQAACIAQGYKYDIPRSLTEFIEIITEYLTA